jgi:mono/diheme cytochrome c family protein
LKLNFLIIAALTATSMWAADAVAGKAVYAAKCKSCHGADGAGNPAIAKAMKVEMKPLSATTADVKAVITNGQGKMKPMPSITGADLDNVVAYVNSLKK